jgi:threonine/homoserine/homoserine lactone efflux protein
LFIDPSQHQGLLTFAAMALTIAALTAAYCLSLCAFAQTIAGRVRANQTLARLMQRLAGVFLIGFGLRLGSQ